MSPSRSFILSALIAAAVAHAAAQNARLRITAPTESTYVAGEVLLRAVIEPASSARDVVDVTFYADAQKACTVTTPPFECEWDAGARIRSHQIRVVARLKNGEPLAQTVTTKKLEVNETVDVDVVQIQAVVTDDRGRFVPDLTQKDFEVREDGVLQKLSSFTAERTPLELVTAIDVSQSVTEALPGMRAAAIRFLAGLEPTDQATIVGFNESVYPLVKRTTDQTMRERAISRLKPWGGTALYDAIIRSLDLLGGQTGGRRAIVLFTDGEDQNSHASIQAALDAVKGSDAMIYAVGQGRAVHAKNLQKLLDQIAKTSGGRAFFADSPADLDRIFGEILEDLHHQYLISYPPPHDQHDGKWHKIAIKAGGGKYKVRHRDGYQMRAARN